MVGVWARPRGRWCRARLWPPQFAGYHAGHGFGGGFGGGHGGGHGGAATVAATAAAIYGGGGLMPGGPHGFGAPLNIGGGMGGGYGGGGPPGGGKPMGAVVHTTAGGSTPATHRTAWAAGRQLPVARRRGRPARRRGRAATVGAFGPAGRPYPQA